MTQDKDGQQSTAKPAEDAADAADAPAGDAPAGDAPAGDAKAEDAGAEDAGAEDAGAAPELEAAAPAPAPSSGAGAAVAVAVVTTLLVLVAVGIAAYATWPQWRGALVGDAGEAAAAVAARVDGLETRLDDLAARATDVEDGLGAVRARLADAPDGGALEALAARVAALEEAPAAAESGAAPGAADPALARRLDRLEQRVADAPGADPAVVTSLARDAERLAADVTALGQRLDALEGRAAEASAVLRLSERLDAVAETARRAVRTRSDTQALLLAVAQLNVAVDAGRDYAAELRTVRALAPEDADFQARVDSLARHARGIPTRSVLAASLDDLAPDIVRASIGPEEDGWWRETVQRIAALVSVKRTDQGGEESVPALVARAERAVDHGDIAEAVAALERLQGPAAAAAAPWLAAARAHVQAQATLGDLASSAIALAGAEESTAPAE